MPRKSKFRLKPLGLSHESVGERLAILRKEKGLTQKEIAEKIGIIQALISDYERGKLRLNDEMVTRFALALDVTADEILGLDQRKNRGKPPSLKIMRRLQKIEELPPAKQKSILHTIDLLIKAEKGTA